MENRMHFLKEQTRKDECKGFSCVPRTEGGPDWSVPVWE